MSEMKKHYNLVYIFADQWRAQAFGFAGDPNVRTPNLDRFASESVRVENAISTCPVCAPYRGSMITGRLPLRNGVFSNDIRLKPDNPAIGREFRNAGYRTAYVGKWHLHAGGRSGHIPVDHRMGFEYWKVLECTHDYLDSRYYDQDETVLSTWPGYDADAQTDDVISFLQDAAAGNEPFALFLSWGPPHAPPPYERASLYDQYPPDLADTYDPAGLLLRANVPESEESDARRVLAGYYTHCTALDRAFGRLYHNLEAQGLLANTVVVFTSDHGDMLGSQGLYKKQSPFEESVRVPFLIRIPDVPARQDTRLFVEPEDILPTMLAVSGAWPVDREPPPELALDGRNLASALRGEGPAPTESVVLALYIANGQWREGLDGGPFGYHGREYRGIRTLRYTYVRERSGPWLLFDNVEDPFQLENVVSRTEYAELQASLEETLMKELSRRSDRFQRGIEYVNRSDLDVDKYNSVRFVP